jgi:Fis family transcriptional regulator
MPIEHKIFSRSSDNILISSATRYDEKTEKAVLRDCVRDVLARYFSDLEGHQVDDLYQLVLTEVEVPLLETVLNHTKGNQSKAAQLLGLNRGTLRKKIKQYNISYHAE